MSCSPMTSTSTPLTGDDFVMHSQVFAGKMPAVPGLILCGPSSVIRCAQNWNVLRCRFTFPIPRLFERGFRNGKRGALRNCERGTRCKLFRVPSSEFVTFRVPRHAMDDNQATHQTSKATTMSFAQEIYQKSLSLPPEDGRAIVDELQGAARLLPQARGRFLIIVDTGFWFGLLDRRDRYHESCRRFSCADSAANLAG